MALLRNDQHTLTGVYALDALDTAREVARFERHLKNGVSKQWNFFVQKSFARSWFVSAGYSGTASRNLSNRNQVFESKQNVPASVLATWKQQKSPGISSARAI